MALASHEGVKARFRSPDESTDVIVENDVVFINTLLTSLPEVSIANADMKGRLNTPSANAQRHTIRTRR